MMTNNIDGVVCDENAIACFDLSGIGTEFSLGPIEETRSRSVALEQEWIGLSLFALKELVSQTVIHSDFLYSQLHSAMFTG